MQRREASLRGGVSSPLGDLPVPSARQENDSCVTTVDRVGQLPLQAEAATCRGSAANNGAYVVENGLLC